MVDMRIMIKEDISVCVEISRECDRYPLDERQFKLAIQDKDCLPFIAEINSEIVGICIMNTKDRSIEIWSFCVSKLWQKQGIGTEMLDFAKKRLGQKRNKLVARISDENLDAHKFLQKNGFWAFEVLRGQSLENTDIYQFEYYLT